nr:hypothetical protein [Tanacetum cinerariifolium]
KEIAKPITPPSESVSEKDSDPEQAQRDKDMQNILALIAKYFKKIYKPTNNNLKTSSYSIKKNVDITLRYKNDNQTGQFRNQRTLIVTEARETIGSQVVQQTRSKSKQAYNVMTNNINHYRELVDQPLEKHSHNHFCSPTALDMKVLIKTCLMTLAIKTHNDSFTFVHELKEMHTNLKYVESRENEIDKLKSDKVEFSNMYDILLQECVSNDVMFSYFQSLSELDAHFELQCLYLHKVKECECLAQKLSKQTECVSKEVYTKLLQSFAKLEKHSISFELALQQCQEQMKNDTFCKEKASNVFQ